MAANCGVAIGQFGAQQNCDAPIGRIAAHGIYRSITRRRASRHTVGGQQRRTTSLQRGVARERAAPICSTTSRVKKTATEGTLSKGQQDWGQDTALARRCQVKRPAERPANEFAPGGCATKPTCVGFPWGECRGVADIVARPMPRHSPQQEVRVGGPCGAAPRREFIRWPSPGWPPPVRWPDRYSRPMLHNVAAQAWERAVSGTGVAVLGGGGVAGWDADRVRLRVLGRQSWR